MSGWWGLNIYRIKRGYDTTQENVILATEAPMFTVVCTFLTVWSFLVKLRYGTCRVGLLEIECISNHYLISIFGESKPTCLNQCPTFAVRTQVLTRTPYICYPILVITAGRQCSFLNGLIDVRRAVKRAAFIGSAQRLGLFVPIVIRKQLRR